MRGRVVVSLCKWDEYGDEPRYLVIATAVLHVLLLWLLGPNGTFNIIVDVIPGSSREVILQD